MIGVIGAFPCLIKDGGRPSGTATQVVVPNRLCCFSPKGEVVRDTGKGPACRDQACDMEEYVVSAVINDSRVKLLMTVPGINVYSAAAIISEVNDISRFSSK